MTVDDALVVFRGNHHWRRVDRGPEWQGVVTSTAQKNGVYEPVTELISTAVRTSDEVRGGGRRQDPCDLRQNHISVSH